MADTLPLKSDCLLVILCTEGEGTIRIDLEEIPVSGNSLISVFPSDYVSFPLSHASSLKFTVLACTKTELEVIIPRVTDLMPIMVNAGKQRVINLHDEEMDSFKTVFKLIDRAVSAPRSPFGSHRIHALVQSVLFDIFDRNAIAGRNNPRSRKEDIMGSFIIDVSRNFRNRREVSFYAEKLGISPKHLSSVTKDSSGKTAGEIIENYVIMEAKFLLKTTDLPIRQIAARLNFSNQSFFGKYFRNIMGLSPSEFRKRPFR